MSSGPVVRRGSPRTSGVAQRADVKAVVDAANTTVAPILNKVIGDATKPNQVDDIRRAPTRLFESAMGNLVADAMRESYGTEVEAAYTNSGGLRQDLLCATITGTEQTCQITAGELFAVLPFGNATVIETLDGRPDADRLHQRVHAGVRCRVRWRDRPVPADLRPQGAVPLRREGPGHRRDLEGPERRERHPDPARCHRHVRFVTNDFMYTGGDGYAVFTQGTDVLQTGDPLLDVVTDYIVAHQPVTPGRRRSDRRSVTASRLIQASQGRSSRAGPPDSVA